jgi:hypothetical protein
VSVSVELAIPLADTVEGFKNNSLLDVDSFLLKVKWFFSAMA